MADRTPRRARVLETRPLTPQMIRVVLGGEGLEGFGAGAFTDHYVKLRITPPGASEPRTRTYTVRGWDAERGRLAIDFVHHGDSGVAGPWAAAAQPGDELLLLGPGGASRSSTSRPARCTPSSTARRARCARSGATC
jgi:NADPH-dependent ferric siderophore reductase